MTESEISPIPNFRARASTGAKRQRRVRTCPAPDQATTDTGFWQTRSYFGWTSLARNSDLNDGSGMGGMS